MQTKILLPNSARKFIRREKARIHGTVLPYKEQQDLISQMYKKFEKRDTNNANKHANDTNK